MDRIDNLPMQPFRNSGLRGLHMSKLVWLFVCVSILGVVIAVFLLTQSGARVSLSERRIDVGSGGILTSLAATHTHILASTSDGFVHAFDIASGKRTASLSLNVNPLNQQASAFAGGLALISDNGELHICTDNSLGLLDFKRVTIPGRSKCTCVHGDSTGVYALVDELYVYHITCRTSNKVPEVTVKQIYTCDRQLASGASSHIIDGQHVYYVYSDSVRRVNIDKGPDPELVMLRGSRFTGPFFALDRCKGIVTSKGVQLWDTRSTSMVHENVRGLYFDSVMYHVVCDYAYEVTNDLMSKGTRVVTDQFIDRFCHNGNFFFLALNPFNKRDELVGATIVILNRDAK